MAYQAEIQIGVKGVRDLRNAQARIERLSRTVDEANKKPLFNTAVVANLNTYNAVLAKANRTLGKTQIELDSAGNAVGDYKKALTNLVRAQADANEAKRITNNLLDEEANKLGLVTQKLREYNAAAAPARQVGSMAGAYLRPNEAQLRGQTSSINPQAQIKAAKEEQIRQEQQLLAANNENIKRLRLRAQIEEKIADVRSARIEREKSASFLGSSGTAPQGPFAGAGALGFPVALPLLKGERKALDTSNKIAEILERRKRLREELGGSAEKLAAVTRKGVTDEERVNGQIRQRFGLRGALQALENESLVAAAKANREEDELTQEKTKQLELEKFINKERVKQSVSRRRRIVETAKETRRRRKEAIGSGIIGGAFPLLFGQGAGASVGGAVGGVAGGLVGGQFGFGLSLVGTQLGTIFDTLVTKAGSLANSLNTTGEILSGLEEAGFKVSDATKSVIASYEKAGLLSDAYALALEEINRVLGPGGVEKVNAYKTETQKLNDEFEKISGSLQGELIPALTGLLRIILGAKAAFDDFAGSPLGQLFLKGVKETAFNAPGGGGLRGASLAISALQVVGAPTGLAEKPTAQRLAEEAVTLDRLDTQQKLNKAAREERYLVAAQINLAKVGNDLLKEEVVAARERVIQETFLATVRKEGITPQQILLAGDKKRLATAQLEAEIRKATEAATARQNAELKKQNTELEKQAALMRKIKSAQISAQLAQDIFKAQPLPDPTPFSRVTPDQKRSIAITLQKLKHEAELAQINNKNTNELQRQADLDKAAAKNSLTLLNINRAYTESIKQRDESFITQTESLNAQLAIATATTREQEQQAQLEFEILKLRRANTNLTDEQKTVLEDQTRRLFAIQNLGPLDQFISDGTKSLRDLEQVAVDVSQGIGNAIGNSIAFGINDLVAGTKSAEEVFADFLKNIANLLAQTAAQLIATYIAIGIAKAFAGLGGDYGTGAEKPLTTGIDYSDAFSSGGFGISARADGGPVANNVPYLVGEEGPELFVPFQNGTIIPNGQTQQMMNGASQSGGNSSTVNNSFQQMQVTNVPFTRSAEQASVIAAEQETAKAIRNPGPIDVRYESQVINAVEYVTAEQHQKGMAQAADRGRALTLASLQNSVKARRRVGL